jgi:uncharacterized protein YyaL (SSP411 family)
MQITENQAIIKMAKWLGTMRTLDGYSGPVSHWWQNCLQYTGVGLDWRYEGIILGYLNLYKNTGSQIWLEKAKQAGNDLVRGLTPTGNYRNSNFEANPYPGGTPHEATCDIGLLALAHTLTSNTNSDWQKYANVAQRNIQAYLIGKLWHPECRYFSNSPTDSLLVLNKAATIVEALFAWTLLFKNADMFEEYGLPSINLIIENQIKDPGSLLDGAIDQSIQGKKVTGMYFPFYIARCIPALLIGYQWTRKEQYLDAAKAAINFILRVRLPNGSFPQVIYANGRIKKYPQWISGVGDILRVMELVQQYYIDISKESTHEWLMNGFADTLACQTAQGFSSQGNQRKPRDIPDFLDILPVCGWVDKAFRYLTDHITGKLDLGPSNPQIIDRDCFFNGRYSLYHEDASVIEVSHKNKVLYRWQKGKNWADIPVMFG